MKWKIKNLFEDLFSPYVFLFRFFKKYYKTSFDFLKTNKELVIILTYGLWILIQSTYLFFWFWIEWLNYISLKFSIILLAILFFLGFLWLPLMFLFITSILLLFFWLLPFILVLFIIPLIIWKIFHKFFQSQKFKEFDKFMKFMYVANFILILITLWYSLVSKYSIEKPIELFTEKNWKIIGNLIFYNQDYYFINNCSEKIVIPSSQVTWVHFLCPIIWCTQEKAIKISQLKSDYCNSLKK